MTGETDVQGQDEPPLQARVATLTQREREIWALLGQGQTRAMIANTLHISAGTVKSHSRKIYDKLQVSSQAMATCLYWQYKEECTKE